LGGRLSGHWGAIFNLQNSYYFGDMNMTVQPNGVIVGEGISPFGSTVIQFKLLGFRKGNVLSVNQYYHSNPKCCSNLLLKIYYDSTLETTIMSGYFVSQARFGPMVADYGKFMCMKVEEQHLRLHKPIMGGIIWGARPLIINHLRNFFPSIQGWDSERVEILTGKWSMTLDFVDEVQHKITMKIDLKEGFKFGVRGEMLSCELDGKPQRDMSGRILATINSLQGIGFSIAAKKEKSWKNSFSDKLLMGNITISAIAEHNTSQHSFFGKFVLNWLMNRKTVVGNFCGSKTKMEPLKSSARNECNIN